MAHLESENNHDQGERWSVSHETRFAKIEAVLESVITTLADISASNKAQARKTDEVSSIVSKLQAGQGRVPTPTLVGIASAGAAVLSLVVYILVSVGTSYVKPILGDVESLRDTQLSDARWQGRMEERADRHEEQLRRLELVAP